MVRVRKLVLAIAAASALSSGMAHALGLGEVTLKSALNQPLDAEIQLLEVRDLSASEVLPSLATPDDFAKAGIDRQFFLNDLTFTPIFRPNGKSVLHVTSKKPVREPYLNFLVQVLWPNGRLLHEYTLLLDPPVYSPQAAAAVAPQLPISAPARSSQAQQAPRPAAAPAAPRTAPAAGGQYTTTSRDNLWDIAAKHRDTGSVQQNMLAIQELNPNAFLDSNINRLKSGQVLRLPAAGQVKSRSQPDAAKEVNAQTAAWREGRTAEGGTPSRQLDATHRAEAGAAPSKADAKDNLSLVSPDAKGSKAGKGTKGDAKALNDQLAVTQESLDTTRRDNEELKSRMTDLQSQLDKLQRLIQLKNDQLAKLQADSAASAAKPVAGAPAAGQPAPGTAMAGPALAAVPATAGNAPAPADANAPSGAVVGASPAPSSPAPVTATPATAVAPAANPTPPATPPSSTDATLVPAPGATPPAPAPAPAVAPDAAADAAKKPDVSAPTPAPAAQPAGTFDDLLSDPMMLGIICGSSLLVLLLLLLLLARRRRAQREAEEEMAAELAIADEPSFAAEMHTESDLDELDLAPAEVEVPLAETPAAAGDPLGEADIYIAYGRFNQAAELLQNAIKHEPQRADLRLKLMEVHAELNDHEGFAAQERGVDAIGGHSAEVDYLKARYPSMALVAAGGIAAAAVAADLNDFGLDDPIFDESDFKESDFDQAVPVLTTTAEHSSLDDNFDLSLDDLDAEPAKAHAPASFDELADLSLDDDFSLDAPLAPATAAKADELSFDALLEQETAKAPAGKSDAELADELAEFDLGLPEDKAQALEEDFLLDFDKDNDSFSAEPAVAHDLPSDFDLSLADEETGSSDIDAELDRLAQSTAADHSVVQPKAPSFTADDVAALGDDASEFDFLSDTDESSTKLDLARAYIDMGDHEGARDILGEVLSEGDDGQKGEARKLLSGLV